MACNPDVFNGTSNWGEQIRCLREEITELRTEIDRAGTSAGNFSSKLGSSFNIMQSMGAEIKNISAEMKKFATTAQQQYDYTEKIAEAYKSTGKEIGISVGRSKDLSASFKSAYAQASRFGATIDQTQGVYQDFAENSGRVRILGDDEVTNILKLQHATGLYGSEATSLYETLDLMGVSNVEATERLEQVVKDSQSIGLNSSKVIKTLSTNMKSMQQYSFANGVKGMTEMAKLAVKMRLDVSEMLGMADKFYEPEAAIEAAANLQMLGGDIAKAFGDPFETMYLARNKPEELAKKVGDMVENMMQFNEATGEYEFPAEARMQLKAAGTQLGINVESMIEMSRQTAKMKDVKDKLSAKGMFSEDELEGIASMARLEGGQFKVDVYDENGAKVSKSIDELTSGDAKMLLQSPKDEMDYMTKMIDNSMTTNQLLESIRESFRATFTKEFDLYKFYEDSSKETVSAIRDATLKSVETASQSAKESMLGELRLTGMGSFEELDKTLANAVKSMDDFINQDMEINTNGVININNKTTNENFSQGGGSGGATDVNMALDKERDEWCKNNNQGGYDPNTKRCTGGLQRKFAKGGIVTKPTNALIGEAGEAEAVFPLSKLENFIQTQKMGGKITLEGNPTITLNINSDNPNLTFSEDEKTKLKDNILSVVTKMFNNGGLPDGSSVPQGSKGFIQTMR
jgi:hypothetical protein